MPAKSIEPLKKVTVDLFENDVNYLRAMDINFSETVREAVHLHIMHNFIGKDKPKRLGDLDVH